MSRVAHLGSGRRDPERVLDLGWARCGLEAGEQGLSLRAEADDADALGQVCELIARHLESHAGAPIVVPWSHVGSAGSHDDRRDAMRAFHARMRRG